MHTVIASDSPARHLSSLTSTRHPEERFAGADAMPWTSRQSLSDLSLLVAALEEIESRRAALERLFEEDLLWRCLI